MKVSIRQAGSEEAEAIAATRRAAALDLTRRFGPGEWSSEATAAGVLSAMRRGRVFVAVDAGAVVGTMTLSTRRPLAIDAACFTRVKTPIYLTSMAVHPDAQGSGVGRALLADAEQRARAWPAMRGQAIRLDAFDAAAGAGGFYVRCGYSERARRVFRSTPLIYFERLIS